MQPTEITRALFVSLSAAVSVRLFVSSLQLFNMNVWRVQWDSQDRYSARVSGSDTSHQSGQRRPPSSGQRWLFHRARPADCASGLLSHPVNPSSTLRSVTRRDKQTQTYLFVWAHFPPASYLDGWRCPGLFVYVCSSSRCHSSWRTQYKVCCRLCKWSHVGYSFGGLKPPHVLNVFGFQCAQSGFTPMHEADFKSQAQGWGAKGNGQHVRDGYLCTLWPCHVWSHNKVQEDCSRLDRSGEDQ